MSLYNEAREALLLKNHEKSKEILRDSLKLLSIGDRHQTSTALLAQSLLEQSDLGMNQAEEAAQIIRQIL